MEQRADLLQRSLIHAGRATWPTSASAACGSGRGSTRLADDINRLLPIPVKKVGIGPEIEQMLDQILVSTPRRFVERRGALFTIDAVICIAVANVK